MQSNQNFIKLRNLALLTFFNFSFLFLSNFFRPDLVEAQCSFPGGGSSQQCPCEANEFCTETGYVTISPCCDNSGNYTGKESCDWRNGCSCDIISTCAGGGGGDTQYRVIGRVYKDGTEVGSSAYSISSSDNKTANWSSDRSYNIGYWSNGTNVTINFNNPDSDRNCEWVFTNSLGTELGKGYNSCNADITIQDCCDGADWSNHLTWFLVPKLKTVTIQGIKQMEEPKGYRGEPINLQDVTCSNYEQTITDNLDTPDYHINNIYASTPTTCTITNPTENYMDVGYSRCDNATTCHETIYWLGNKVSFTTPASDYTDLWWHFKCKDNYTFNTTTQKCEQEPACSRSLISGNIRSRYNSDGSSYNDYGNNPAISGVNVKITNENSGETVTATTDPSGNFSGELKELCPGDTYKVEIDSYPSSNFNYAIPALTTANNNLAYTAQDDTWGCFGDCNFYMYPRPNSLCKISNIKDSILSYSSLVSNPVFPYEAYIINEFMPFNKYDNYYRYEIDFNDLADIRTGEYGPTNNLYIGSHIYNDPKDYTLKLKTTLSFSDNIGNNYGGISESTCLIGTEPAWWQVDSGSAYTEYGSGGTAIKSLVPAGERLIKETGFATWNAGGLDTGSGGIGSGGVGVEAGKYDGTTYDYAYWEGKLADYIKEKTTDSINNNGSGDAKIADWNNGIYEINLGGIGTNLTIHSIDIGSKEIAILVQGNVEIQGDIKTNDDGIFILIVGDTIDPSTGKYSGNYGKISVQSANYTELEGFYIADNIIDTSSFNQPLTVKGGLISWTGINLGRRYSADGNDPNTSSDPAETFEQNTAMINALKTTTGPLKAFRVYNYTWQEVAP